MALALNRLQGLGVTEGRKRRVGCFTLNANRSTLTSAKRDHGQYGLRGT